MPMQSDVIEPEELTLADGEYLVRKARKSVELAFLGEEVTLDDAPAKLMRKGAAFVTIYTLTDDGKRRLRGCIGFVKPFYPLAKTVTIVAREAAFNDPRFPPLKPSETPISIFEVSVLSSLRKLKGPPEDRAARVRVGQMGLVVEKGFASGLLLPQVPIEEGWDSEQFLDYTCLKAGLPPQCWRNSDVNVYYFIARVFEEKLPGGPVIEKKLV